MDLTRDSNDRFGIVSYIACCLFALLCWAVFAYAEVMMLQQKTEAQVHLIEQAVAKLDKAARK